MGSLVAVCMWDLVPWPGIEPRSPALGARSFCFCFFINLFILFIYFWLRWVFVAARGLSLDAVSGGYSSLRCVGFLLRWLLLLRSTGSRHAGFSSCGTRSLECWLSSCGTRAQLLRSMWDLSWPGLEPVSPALAGGFLTTAPPGKPRERGVLTTAPPGKSLSWYF